jgi:hypothetical protein
VAVTIKPFEASKLKIRRARRHLNELQNAIQTFLSGKPLEIVVENWADAPEYLHCHAWTARIRSPVPAEFSAVMGDVVHNLRGALDLMACDLVRLNGKQPDNVYFPFAGSGADFDKVIRLRNMHKASPDVIAILRAWKPYKGGNEYLRSIHDMDIADKHKALIPVVSAASIPSFGLKMGEKVNQIPEWSSIVVDDGHKMVIMPAINSVPLGTIIPCAIRVTFAPGDIFAGHEVLKVLENLAKLADSVVHSFETHFERRNI